MITEGNGGSGQQHHNLNTTSKPFVHPCDVKNGGCEHVCNKKGLDAICSCKMDYELQEDGTTCKLLPPCEQARKGGCEHKCKPNPAEEDVFSCECDAGFELEKNRKNCSESK